MSTNKYYSQWCQDQYVDEQLDHKHGGIFVDVGASNGISGSNSYFFEQSRDWTGICMEPNPACFKQLQNNREAVCLWGCAYNRCGNVIFSQLSGYTQNLSGISETYAPQHHQRIERERRIHGGDKHDLIIPCIELATVLSAFGISHVDYLSIDTEGSELQVLEGIDFSKATFGVMTIEQNYPEDAKVITKYLSEKGYQMVNKLGGDAVYTPVK